MSNGRLTIELDTKIDNMLSAYSYWLRSQVSEPVSARSFERAREALEIAIEEAIQRGPLTPEPAVITERDLTANINRAESLVMALERAIVANRESNTQETVRALSAAKWELVRQFADALTDAEPNKELEAERDAEHARAERLSRHYTEERERASAIDEQLATARAEIARLEEIIRATDSTPADAETLEAALVLVKWHKTTGVEIADTLTNASGWLDVVADGYLRESAVPNGVRKLAARLRAAVGKMEEPLAIIRGNRAE